jgi:hypothetical protein
MLKWRWWKFFPHHRCPFSVVSTCEHLPRRWASVQVRKFAASAQKLVRNRFLRENFHLVIMVTGMYALRERRQHVTQEDFEFAVAKVRVNCISLCSALTKLMDRS